jgi:hypothetical protein
LDSEKHTVTSSQLPTSQAAGVSESKVDNSLHVDQLNVELRLPDSGSPKMDATAHKDARLDPAAAVVPEIVGNNPHIAEAVCQESLEKLVNTPLWLLSALMMFLMNHQLSMLVDKKSQSWLLVVA